jgi:PAS domain S-box-containing protein
VAVQVPATTRSIENGENALAISEARYRALTSALSSLVWNTAADGQIVDMPEWRALTGQTVDEVRGQGWLDALHPDDRDRSQVAWQTAVDTRSTYVTEYRIRRWDGEYRWHQARGVAIQDEDGSIREWVGICVDMEDSKRLREGEARFHAITNSIDQMIWSTLPDGYHDFYNQRWYDFLGMPEGSTDGEGWNGVFHPEDQQRAWAVWRHSLATGELYEIEYRMRHKSGQYRWVLGRAQPVRGDDGRITRWFGTCTDIQDLVDARERFRESEARLHAITNSIDQLIWSTLPDGYHDFYNQRWYDFLGMPEGSTDGEGWNEVFHPDDQQRAWAVWRHSLATGEVYEIEYRMRHKSGQYRWMLGRAQPVRGEDGRITRWFGTCTDIHDLIDTRERLARSREELERVADERNTALKKTEKALQDLRSAQDRLIQTEKLASLGQLTAGIAHEIKNPLNFVNNFSDLSVELIDELHQALNVAELDDNVRAGITEITNLLRANLDKISQHGKRADSIVKNMLLHSRDGSGERRPADINAIVEESLNLAYHGARAERSGFNIKLQRNLDPAAGIIDLYPQEITRVFLNLISNGFYAATKRKEADGEAFEPMLSATTKRFGDKVEIRIRDNGTGIPREVRDKMFNPFFTTKPAGEGTGLGLSMSHDIVVKQHGGKIDVDTEQGVFTEIIITLPRTVKASAGVLI